MHVVCFESSMSAADAALRMASDGGLCWLDGDGAGRQGRYSFVASTPCQSVRAGGDDKEPFTILRSALAAARDLEPASGNPAEGPNPWEVPRWAGFVSYDALVPGRPVSATTGPDRPALSFGRYDAWFVEDHLEGRGFVVGDDPDACERLQERLLGTATAPHGTVTELSRPGADDHARRVAAALTHIARGDVYQVNLAHAWHGRYQGDPLWLALAMRAQSPVPFGMYLDAGNLNLVSRSMEQFIRYNRETGELWSRPIKGTRPRPSGPNVTAEDDQRGPIPAELRADPKERAEHTMIVDLMRNDLGRVAEVGSVQVPEIMHVEAYSDLYHLVSTVRCRTRAGTDVADVLAATFPPGSVTGAPKLRALEIIDGLEGTARGPYTGAVGFIDRAGGGNFAVAIRTAVIEAGRVTYHAGGGIVAASDAAREIDETVLKAQVFLKGIGAQGPGLDP